MIAIVNCRVWGRRWAMTALAAALLFAVRPGWSQVSAAPAAPIIPAGTPIILTLGERLKSGEASVGQQVPFAVAEQVLIGQTVVLAVGTPAYGEVERSRHGGAFGRAGTLRLRCDYLLLPNGVHVPVRAASQIDRSGRSAAGAAAGTAIVTGLAVGDIAYTGSNIQTNFFNPNPDRTKPTLAGVAAGALTALVVSSIFRGGDVTLLPGQRLEVTVVQDTPLTADAASPPSIPQ